jgi:phosphoglycerate dehydrogenase-like enzyme
MAWFRGETGGMVVDRQLRLLSRVDNGGGAPTGRVLICARYLDQRRHLLRGLEDAGYELTYNDTERTWSEAELMEALPGHIATLAGSEPYNARVLAAAPQLRVVARLGVGHDQIDLPAATRNRTAVAMAFGTNHEAVADHTFALMAALATQLIAYDRSVRAGGWDTCYHGRLHGTTVGLIGFGRIGRAVAKRCKGFAMDVLVHDPVMDADTVARLGCRLVGLDQLMQQSDYVSLHAPLNPDTLRMVDARLLGLMKPSAFLINTARGPIVDEPALVEALRSRRIAGAGLDVLAIEPPGSSPLLELDNVVLTPHVAGLSDWAIERMTARCVDTIMAVCRGEDPGGGLLLNPEALGKR